MSLQYLKQRARNCQLIRPLIQEGSFMPFLLDSHMEGTDVSNPLGSSNWSNIAAKISRDIGLRSLLAGAEGTYLPSSYHQVDRLSEL